MSEEFILRMLLAATLGGFIGLEREYRAKEAGFRTHFLVGLGAAVFMILSKYGYEDVTRTGLVRLDPSRIAAQVVSGIGFIGAGCIIFQRHVVRGLTTAAGLWVTSAIGLACGSGMYLLALAATGSVILCLETVNFIHHKFGTKTISISFSTNNRKDISVGIDYIKQLSKEISTYELKSSNDSGRTYFTSIMKIKLKRDFNLANLVTKLTEFDNVYIEEF